MFQHPMVPTHSLERPWESASDLDLVPSGLGQVDFVFADDDLVATERI